MQTVPKRKANAKRAHRDIKPAPVPDNVKGAFCTVFEVPKIIQGITYRTVRTWLAKDTDGFRTECAVKIGHRVLIDVAAMLRFFDASRGAKVNYTNYR